MRCINLRYLLTLLTYLERSLDRSGDVTRTVKQTVETCIHISECRQRATAAGDGVSDAGVCRAVCSCIHADSRNKSFSSLMSLVLQ